MAFGAGLRLDELESGFHAEDERGRAEDASLEASRRDDGGLAAAVGDGAARARVDDVAVANAIDDDAAQVIAGGSDALAAGERERTFECAGGGRVFESDVPRGATGRESDGAEVVAKIDERGGKAVVTRDLGDDIDGPFFAEAAKIEGHAGLGQKHVAGRALNFFPTDEALRGGELDVGGETRRRGFIIPEAQQRQRGGIEHALRHEMKAVAQGEKAFHLGVNGDGRAAGGGVDARDETVGAEAGIFRLEGGDPGDGGGFKGLGLGGGSCGVLDFATGAEGGPREHAQRYVRRRRSGGGRWGAVTGEDEGHGRTREES